MNEPTKGKVGNIFIVPIGFYRPTMESQAMLDACKNTYVYGTSWAYSQRDWMGVFEDDVRKSLSNDEFLTPYEKALRWHGIYHHGRALRVVDVNPSLRMHKKLGMLSKEALHSYDELVVIPFDTWAVPFLRIVISAVEWVSHFA